MFVNSLEHAIKLIELGERDESREILKQLIKENRHDLAPWFWLLETCSTNEQRIDILKICLVWNPDSEPVKQAIERLKAPLPPKISIPQSAPMRRLNTKTVNGLPRFSSILEKIFPNHSAEELLITELIGAIILQVLINSCGLFWSRDPLQSPITFWVTVYYVGSSIMCLPVLFLANAAYAFVIGIIRKDNKIIILSVISGLFSVIPRILLFR